MATVKMEGLDELQDALGKLSKDAEKRVDAAVQATGLEVRGDIVKRIQRGPATGRVYGNHQASAPGEAPATDTGRLVNSTVYKREGRISASVGSDLAYAAMLEFGTSKIDPRPAWIPALEDAKPKYIKRLEKALCESINRTNQ